jgi:hypothetical protein
MNVHRQRHLDRPAHVRVVLLLQSQFLLVVLAQDIAFSFLAAAVNLDLVLAAATVVVH